MDVDSIIRVGHIIGVLYTDGRVDLLGVKNEQMFLPIYIEDIPFSIYVLLVYQADGGKDGNVEIRDITEAFREARIEKGLEESTAVAEKATSTEVTDPENLAIFQAVEGTDVCIPATKRMRYTEESAGATASTSKEPAAADDNLTMTQHEIMKLRAIFGAVMHRKPTNGATMSYMRECTQILSQSVVQEALFGRKLGGENFDKFDVLVVFMDHAISEFTRQADRVIAKFSHTMDPFELPEFYRPKAEPLVEQIPGKRLFKSLQKEPVEMYSLDEDVDEEVEMKTTEKKLTEKKDPPLRLNGGLQAVSPSFQLP